MKNKVYLFTRFLLVIVFKIFFSLKITGRENIPRDDGCIIASNHLSYLDPVVLSVACPRILNFMAKEDLFEHWCFRKLITILNAFPIKRGQGDLKAIRFAIEKLKKKGALIIFPEGTRSITGNVVDSTSGVGLLAAKSGVAVIPTLITGTDRSMPVKSKNIFLFTPITVHFSKPLKFSDLHLDLRNKNDYQIFSNKLVERIKELKIK